MKVFLFAVVGLFLTSGADAWRYTYSTILANYATEGTVCSDNGYKIVVCQCGDQTPSNPKGVSETCVLNGNHISQTGCKLQESNGVVAYCMFDAGNSDICANYCGCGSIYGAWSSAGSNRASRPVTTMNSTSYGCFYLPNTTTEYGCAAGYYQSGGSGSTMTCTRCPSSGGVYGTNDIGTTDITTCCIPANSSMKDSGGAYTFTGQCCYTK